MIEVGRLASEEVDAAAEILRDAFDAVYRLRGHTPPFPSLESAIWLCRAYLDLDPEGCAAAYRSGRLVGVGFVHLRGAVASIGPLAARPGSAGGVGRALMRHLTGLTTGCRSVRLFQDAFNPDTFGFYTRLGYSVRDVAPYLLTEEMTAPARPPGGLRLLSPSDLSALERYDRARTGAERGKDFALLAMSGSALIREVGHALSGFVFYRPLPARVIIGPAVADSDEALADLVDGVARALPGRAAVIRASARAAGFLGRAFERGFRVDHLGNLMASGDYDPPPAQLYALFPESL